ncbi:hypothetical protein V8B97DRAFT_66703 [Scleroderma yunnanense]
MVNKRKRAELEDFDSDEPAPGKQILPVANLPKDFNGDPADGMQYLFLVRRDARRLPHITRAHNPYEDTAVHVTQDVPPKSVCDKLPCEKWRIAFQRHFRNLQTNLRQPTIYVRVDQANLPRTLIPEKKDRDAWWMFLTGYPESAWSPAARAVSRKQSKQSQRVCAFSELPRGNGQASQSFVQTTVEDDISVISSASRLTADYSEGHSAICPLPQAAQALSGGTGIASQEVTPNRLQGVDHRTSIHLLMYFAHWINIHLQNYNDLSTTITNNHARWMFSLLTKVEDIVSADDMSHLRNLARACLGIVKKRREENSECMETADAISDASCWMVFTAVASVWGQKDLWMDAEAAMLPSH